MALACVPWTWRNHQALGGLFFIRSNFGLELRMGNHEGAGATLDLSAQGGTERHPRTNEEEARKVQQLGELEYMRQAGREATAWIRSHPAEFLRLTGLRVAQFWLGPIDDLPVALGISAPDAPLRGRRLAGVAAAEHPAAGRPPDPARRRSRSSTTSSGSRPATASPWTGYSCSWPPRRSPP